MDINEYQRELAKLREGVQNAIIEKATLLASTELLGNIKNRIQREGKDSIGAKMKGYSTTPSYFERDEFVKKSAFKAQGKRGFKGEYVVQSTKIKINKKTGKVTSQGTQNRIVKVAPKTMYLENGYKQFREIQGRQTQIKDLTLSGQTMLDYVQGVKGEDIVLGFNSVRSSYIRKDQEAMNGDKIFTATQEEMLKYNQKLLQLYKEEFLKLVNL